MKALIRKHGSTPTKEAQDEIFPETSWPDWVDANGWPLTEENYGYALCEECPEDVADLVVDDFTVTSETLRLVIANGKLFRLARFMSLSLNESSQTLMPMNFVSVQRLANTEKFLHQLSLV